MSRFKIDDFPPHVQDQIRAQIAGYSKPVPPLPTTPVPPLEPGETRQAVKGPNKTEAHYRTFILSTFKDVRFEAITFRMANGHRYTPDWVVFEAGLPIACHECKGGYALHSQQRARLAFDQCAKEFPAFTWTWAVKKPEGWEISHAKA